MERKQRIELIIALLVILGLVVLFAWILWPRPSDSDQDTNQESIVEQSTEEDTRAPIDTTNMPAQPQTIARVFVERFGSFSSESGYTNINDVLGLATVDAQGRLQQLAQDARNQADGEYYGVSTTIISVKEVERTDTFVTYVVTTQREESIASPANTSVKYQDIEITLVSQGDSWLVDTFRWE